MFSTFLFSRELVVLYLCAKCIFVGFLDPEFKSRSAKYRNESFKQNGVTLVHQWVPLSGLGF